MTKLKQVLFNSIFLLSLSSFAHAESSTVYSWRSENGNVVFSETKPTDGTDYKTISVGEPTIIKSEASSQKQKAPPIEINQSDISKLNASGLAEKNMEALGGDQQGDLQIKITSPANEAYIHSKEDKIAVTTSPAITEQDNPIFTINGNPVPATFEGGSWYIPRPQQNIPNELRISGKTADGRDIVTTVGVTFRVNNATVKQMQITGNSARSFRG